MRQKGFAPILILIIIVLVAGGAYYFGTLKIKPKPQVIPTTVPSVKPAINLETSVPVTQTTIKPTTDPTANWKTFNHSTGNYQFKYPPEWSAVIDQNATADTLFGPNASSKSGLGGIEVREIETDPKDFNTLTESRIISQTKANVNGITGYKTSYSNVLNGTNFVFKNTDGLIYNIYINSSNVDDLKIFDQILSTFKFTQ